MAQDMVEVTYTCKTTVPGSGCKVGDVIATAVIPAGSSPFIDISLLAQFIGLEVKVNDASS